MHRSVGDLQILPERLPVTTEGLRDYVLLAREKVQAYGIVLKSLDRQGRQDVYEQTLREGQIVGEQALHAEAALGEVLEDRTHKVRTSQGGSSNPLPEGITHKASHHAQKLHRHPETIKAVVQSAKDRGEIPTRRDVLREILRAERSERDNKILRPAAPAGTFSLRLGDSNALSPALGLYGCAGG